MVDEPVPPDTIRQRLLAWYDEHARDLPWRRTDDPYAIWVSEVMLQQTRVETVVPFFERWMERFPSVEELARAREREVLEVWEGLGYYSRARRLREAAGVVRDRFAGRVPDDTDELRELPGVGAYTAGAVASIAFDVPAPAVDGNVRRVVARLLDLERPTASELSAVVGEWLDPGRPGDFNQALMELGATVCTPRAPECRRCPLEELCRARQAGTVEERPAPRRRSTVRRARFAVLVARDGDGRLVMGRRPADGLLGGMWGFPEAEVGNGAAGATAGGAEGRAFLDAARDLARRIGLGEPPLSGTRPEVAHRYSHIAALYRPVQAVVCAPRPEPVPPWSWLEPSEAASLPLPRVQRRILETVAGATR